MNGEPDAVVNVANAPSTMLHVSQRDEIHPHNPFVHSISAFCRRKEILRHNHQRKHAESVGIAH